MRQPAFARILASSGLSNLADGIATVAWAWLATLLTRDPLLVALVVAALRLPWVLFALPAGIITDRADRRRLLVRANAARAAVFAVVAVAVALAQPFSPPPAGGVSAPALYGLMVVSTLVVGAAEVLHDDVAVMKFYRMAPGTVPPMPADASVLGTLPLPAFQHCEAVRTASPPAGVR